MVYEYRFYEAAEGKLAALDRRFKELTWPVMQRHGFKQVGFWIPGEANQLVYLLAWKDRAAAEVGWKEFHADPEWQRGKAASETEGPLLAKATSQFWNPTEYSDSK